MSRLCTAVVASCLAFLCGAAAAQQAGFPYPPSLPDATEHTYKIVGDVVLRLWVFAPDRATGADARPAAVFFSAAAGGPVRPRSSRDRRGRCGTGAWWESSPTTGSRRVTGTRPWHAVADAQDALHWVRSHAAELGIDPKRIAAGGGSAGGHLAAATATLAHPQGPDHAVTWPNALLLFNPAVVIADIEGSQRSEALAGLFERPLRTMSPYHHVADGHPPTFVVHGKADTVVPVDDAIAYCERVLSMGGDCRLALYDGAGHGFFNREPDFESTLEQMLGFLEGLGWL